MLVFTLPLISLDMASTVSYEYSHSSLITFMILPSTFCPPSSKRCASSDIKELNADGPSRLAERALIENVQAITFLARFVDARFAFQSTNAMFVVKMNKILSMCSSPYLLSSILTPSPISACTQYI
jgi:hypothetical protein